MRWTQYAFAVITVCVGAFMIAPKAFQVPEVPATQVDDRPQQEWVDVATTPGGWELKKSNAGRYRIVCNAPASFFVPSPDRPKAGVIAATTREHGVTIVDLEAIDQAAAESTLDRLLSDFFRKIDRKNQKNR